VIFKARRAGWLGVAGAVMAVAAGSPAVAQVKQTDAAQTPLPQPVGTAELSLINSSWAWSSETSIIYDQSGMPPSSPITYGAYYSPPTYPQFVTGDAITLTGLFKWRKEAIDPVKDATTTPGYFSGKCFTVEPVLAGGNCHLELGWYNVPDPNSKTPPSPSEIYPFVPEPTTALNCLREDGSSQKLDGFCPLACDNRGPHDLSKVRWTPKAFSTGDLSKDSHYTGGFIGFALIGSASGLCTQSKFSMYEHNQRNTQGVPWVTTLIYHSTIEANGFYLAFEDLPMPSADWKSGGSSPGYGAEGDFNDLVYYVSNCAPPDAGGGGGSSGLGGSASTSAGFGGTGQAGSASGSGPNFTSSAPTSTPFGLPIPNGDDDDRIEDRRR